MQLTRIRLSGVKGQHRDLEVGPVTIITGTNWAGKTSALLAAKEVIAPKNRMFEWAADTVEPASAMLVFEREDGPLMVTRSFRPDHAVSLSPGNPRLGIKKTDAAIAKQVASIEHLDVLSFAKLSGGERESRIMLAAASIPEDLPRELDALRALFAESAWELVGTPPAEFRADGLVTWLSDGLKALRSRKSHIARDRKRITENLQEMAERTLALPEGTLAEAKERRAQLGAARSEAVATVAAVTRTSGLAEKLTESLVKHEADLAAATAEVARLEAEIEAAKVESADLVDMAASAASKLAAATAAANASEERVLRAQSRVELAERDLADMETSLEQARDQLGCFDGGDPCGSCGRALDQSASGYEAAVQAVASAEKAVEEFRAALADAKALLEGAEKEKANSAANLRGVQSQTATAIAQGDKAVAERDAKVATLCGQLDDAKRLQTAADARRSETEEQLNGLPGDADPELLGAQIEGFDLKLKQVEADIEALTMAQQDKVNRADWLARRDELTEEFDEVKEALQRVEAWRTAIVSSATSRIESTASMVVDAVLPASRLGVDVTDRGARLVLRRQTGSPEAISVPFAGWSGSERVVATIGAHVAMLSAEAPCWKPVIADDVEVLDGQPFRHLVEAALYLTESGVVDNVILAGVLDERLTHVPEDVLKRCTVIRLPAPGASLSEAA